MSHWTIVPQNVTKMPHVSYMVPMDAKAAAAQIYKMQNRNNFDFLTTNEKIIKNKADDALYKATEAKYMANYVSSSFSDFLKSEVFIYIVVSIILIALILVYQSVM